MNLEASGHCTFIEDERISRTLRDRDKAQVIEVVCLVSTTRARCEDQLTRTWSPVRLNAFNKLASFPGHVEQTVRSKIDFEPSPTERGQVCNGIITETWPGLE